MGRHLFLGLQCPPHWQTAFDEEQVLFGLQGFARLKWHHPERRHLSIKDLQYVDEANIGQIIRVMEEAAASCIPFDLYLSAFGVLHQHAAPDLLCARVAGDVRELEAMWAALDATTASLGYRRHRHRFSPHITLASIPDELRRSARGRVHNMRGRYLPAAGSYNVQRFALLEIVRTSAGVYHKCVATTSMAIH